jgi:hypothetical protein
VLKAELYRPGRIPPKTAMSLDKEKRRLALGKANVSSRRPLVNTGDNQKDIT